MDSADGFAIGSDFALAFAFQLPDYPITQSSIWSSALGRCRAITAISAIGALCAPPLPRHSSHVIPVIPIWRGFQRFSDPRPSALIRGKVCLSAPGDTRVEQPPSAFRFSSVFSVVKAFDFPISAMAPLPLPPVSPNYTQGHPITPKEFVG